MSDQIKKTNRSTASNTGKKKPKKRKKSYTGASRQVQELHALNIRRSQAYLAITFTIASVLLIVHTLDTQSLGTLFSGSQWFFISLFVFPVGMCLCLEDQIRNRYEKKQFRKIRQLLRNSFAWCLGYCLLVLLVTLFAGNTLSKALFFGHNVTLMLYIFCSLLFFDFVYLILRAFRKAISRDKELTMVFLVRQIIVFLSLVLFSGVFNKKGERVAALLQNPDIYRGYRAAGIVLSVSIGAFAGMILMIYMTIRLIYATGKSAAKDKNKRLENLWIRLSTQSVSYSFTLLCFFVAVPVFLKLLQMELEENAMAALSGYQSGVFGLMITAFLLPMLIPAFLTINEHYPLRVCYINNDRMEFNIHIQTLLQNATLTTLFCSIMMLSATSPLLKGLCGVDSALAVRLFRAGCLGPVIYSILLVLVIVLLYIGKFTTLFFIGLIGFLLNTGLGFLLSNVWSLGLYGYVISLLLAGVFSIACILSALIRYTGFRLHTGEVLVYPFIDAAITALVVFLLHLLFALFMPALAEFIVLSIIGLSVYIIFALKMNILNDYTLYELPLGSTIGRVAEHFNLLDDR